MRAFSLAEARDWTGARCSGQALEAVRFEGVSTDTRTLVKGDLFVALRGENFDGHRFLARAEAAGAVAVVVDTENSNISIPQLVVDDTVQALARLAEGNRKESRVQLVAVTGSSGKTTVREMTAAVLSRMGPTLATEGNLNNHIGVPLTLFRLAPEHRYAAIELGASGLGEIAHTVAVAKPRVVILTNAGQAHLEGFGSYENIVLAKGEIIEGVAEGGLVVLNRDDPAFGQWLERAGERRVVSVSRLDHQEADYRVTSAVGTATGQQMTVTGPEGWSLTLSLSFPGEHNQSNALMAIAAARELGATDHQLEDGLAGVQSVKGRLQMLSLSRGLTLIDDSYNANPASMKAAVAVLAEQSGQRVAVFGAMAELGPDARALHAEVGAAAKERGIDRLLVVGPGCEGYVDGFGPETEQFPTHEAAVNAIVSALDTDTSVLVKGSRSSAMDRVVEGIKEKVNN